MLRSLLNLRAPSLLRGNFLVLGSFVAAFALSHFPANRPSAVMIVPVFAAALGMYETFRCLRTSICVYNGTVFLSLYMDLLVIMMILFLAVYPLISQIS